MNLRAVLAVLTGLLCGLAGVRHAHALRSNVSRLLQWDALLSRLALVLKEAAFSLPDALDRAAIGDSEPEAYIRTLAEAVRSHPLVDLGELCASQPVSGIEADCIRTLANQLGRGSVESRLLAIAQAQATLRQMSEQSRDRVLRDAAMYSKLGWTAGACITIMLL